MMSLKQFKALAERYGADLVHWPDRQRLEAQILLNQDGSYAGMASQILARERPLDAAIVAALEADETDSWQDGEQDAALERLRAGIDRQIARSIPTSPRPAWHYGILYGAFRRLPGLSLAGSLRWFGVTAGSGLMVASGFWCGSMQSSMLARPVDLFSALQIAPLSGLWQ